MKLIKIIPLPSFASLLFVGLFSVAAANSAPGQLAAPPQKPANTAPQGIPAFEIAPINSSSWYGRFGVTLCSWIDLGDGVMVIDTGATAADAANLLAQIKETTHGKPVKWIVITHSHQDSNGGFPAFLPTDATVFVHHKASAMVGAAVAKPGKGIKTPTVVGVSDKVFVISGIHGVEIGTMPGHTDSDLYAHVAESGALFVGDLVTPGLCPVMSDPTADPKAWLAALDRIESFHPALIIPTRGEPSQPVETSIATTRKYIRRILDEVVKAKKGNYPDSRVSGELAMQKLGDYCPSQLDAMNALSVYHRISADGTVRVPEAKSPIPPAKRSAPATKK